MEGQALSTSAAIASRPDVDVLLGTAHEAFRELEHDFRMLDRARAAARVWTCAEPVVVLGRSRETQAELDEHECRRRGVAVLRRASGGGTVVIGPGTVQYAFVLAHGHPHVQPTEHPRETAREHAVEPPPLDAIKRACNRVVREALVRSGAEAALESDASGDLRIDDRKVGGLALRRRRSATLLHGTLLTHLADLELIASVLAHPAREPEWRRGRSHREFLGTLAPFDVEAFTAHLARTHVDV